MAKWTRSDFVAIAALAAAVAHGYTSDDTVYEMFADYCEANKANSFDRDRFIRACNMEYEKMLP